MGAWKSSDGGSIPSFGGSNATVTSAGTTTLVTAGANVRGVLLRTVALMCEGGASTRAELRVDGVAVCGAAVAAADNMQELFVPAGLAISAFIANTAKVSATWDIL
ncbi:MAG: hypothetical protein Q7V31_16015 [Parvibaculum sp.]|uniref:hypothetical protein n=1 Tax=Parvibaculum sp. TaxID=2024848 RepID=UPI0027197756|nr:hypothetical protein [Parvibaculum sp.]MDO8840419.1 hypothetical protein [Parvibaculum sp.]